MRSEVVVEGGELISAMFSAISISRVIFVSSPLDFRMRSTGYTPAVVAISEREMLRICPKIT